MLIVQFKCLYFGKDIIVDSEESGVLLLVWIYRDETNRDEKQNVRLKSYIEELLQEVQT